MEISSHGWWSSRRWKYPYIGYTFPYMEYTYIGSTFRTLHPPMKAWWHQRSSIWRADQNHFGVLQSHIGCICLTFLHCVFEMCKFAIGLLWNRFQIVLLSYWLYTFATKYTQTDKELLKLAKTLPSLQISSRMKSHQSMDTLNFSKFVFTESVLFAFWGLS